MEVSTTMTLTEVTYEISTPESSGTRAMSTCGHSDSDWFDWPPAFLKAHWINLQVGRKYALGNEVWTNEIHGYQRPFPLVRYTHIQLGKEQLQVTDKPRMHSAFSNPTCQ